MLRMSEVWQGRIMLAGVGLLSLLPVLLHQSLKTSRIYEIRFMGGLHPAGLLGLRGPLSRLSFFQLSYSSG
jgi:hypothetical protein